MSPEESRLKLEEFTEAVDELILTLDRAKMNMDIFAKMFLPEDCEDIIVAHRKLKKIVGALQEERTQPSV